MAEDSLTTVVEQGFAALNLRLDDFRRDSDRRHEENRSTATAIISGQQAVVSRLSVVEFRTEQLTKEIGSVKDDMADVAIRAAEDLKAVEKKVSGKVGRTSVSEWIGIIGATTAILLYILTQWLHWGPRP